MLLSGKLFLMCTAKGVVVVSLCVCACVGVYVHVCVIVTCTVQAYTHCIHIHVHTMHPRARVYLGPDLAYDYKSCTTLFWPLCQNDALTCWYEAM